MKTDKKDDFLEKSNPIRALAGLILDKSSYLQSTIKYNLRFKLSPINIGSAFRK